MDVCMQEGTVPRQLHVQAVVQREVGHHTCRDSAQLFFGLLGGADFAHAQ